MFQLKQFDSNESPAVGNTYGKGPQRPNKDANGLGPVVAPAEPSEMAKTVRLFQTSLTLLPHKPSERKNGWEIEWKSRQINSYYCAVLIIRLAYVTSVLAVKFKQERKQSQEMY